MGDKLKLKISKKMLIIFAVVVVGLLFVFYFLKPKKEHAEFNSKCGFTGENLIFEQCMTNSAGKSMDDFLNCLKDNGIEEKVRKNFSPLEFALQVGDIKCNELENAINTAKTL
jgi:hypothetical protein